MPRVSERTLREVQEALEAFKDEVNGAGYTPESAKTFTYHAEAFVRWLEHDFEPGSHLPQNARI